MEARKNEEENGGNKQRETVEGWEGRELGRGGNGNGRERGMDLGRGGNGNGRKLGGNGTGRERGVGRGGGRQRIPWHSWSMPPSVFRLPFRFLPPPPSFRFSSPKFHSSPLASSSPPSILFPPHLALDRSSPLPLPPPPLPSNLSFSLPPLSPPPPSSSRHRFLPLLVRMSLG